MRWPRSRPGRLLLVRHGQTPANIEQVWHGHTDTELTAVGHTQARKLGQGFMTYLPQLDAVFCSPLQRARITAEHIARAYGLDVSSDPRLIEFGAGEWEGESFERLRGELAFFKGVATDQHHRAPGGESRAEVTRRFVSAVEEYRQRHPGQSLAVVAHGVVMACAVSWWLHQSSDQWVDYHFSNTAVTELDIEARKLVYFNRTDHLA